MNAERVEALAAALVGRPFVCGDHVAEVVRVVAGDCVLLSCGRLVEPCELATLAALEASLALEADE